MSAPEFATLTTDDLVTGEAVALDLPPAGLGIRIASGLIDVVVTLIVFFVAFFVLVTAALQTDGALIWASFIGTNIVGLPRLPGDPRDAHRRQVGRQARLRAAHRPRRRRADHASSTRSCGR